jgi:hypothetical protein
VVQLTVIIGEKETDCGDKDKRQPFAGRTKGWGAYLYNLSASISLASNYPPRGQNVGVHICIIFLPASL